MSIVAQQSVRAAIDEAALTPDAWMPALRKIAEECGAAHAQLIGIGGPSMVMFNWVSNDSEGLAKTVDNKVVHDPASNYRIIVGMDAPEGKVVGEEEYAKAIQRIVNQEYLEFVGRHSIQNGVQVNLAKSGGGLVGLATLREDRTTQREISRFASLVPHAQTAIKVQSALDHKGALLVAGAYEAMKKAAFIIDALGQVRAITPAAESVLSTSPLWRLDGKKLWLSDPMEDREFQQGLSGALSAPDQWFSDHTSLVVGRLGAHPTVCDIVALPKRDWAMHFRPRVVVSLRDQRGSGDDAIAVLRTAFGFTDVEAQIADLLARGKSRSEIAALRGVSHHTVKTHIKGLFDKAEVTREGQLAAKVRDLVDGRSAK